MNYHLQRLASRIDLGAVMLMSLMGRGGLDSVLIFKNLEFRKQI